MICKTNLTEAHAAGIHISAFKESQGQNTKFDRSQPDFKSPVEEYRPWNIFLLEQLLGMWPHWESITIYSLFYSYLVAISPLREKKEKKKNSWEQWTVS